IIEEYADICDGDYEKAMDILTELIRPVSLEILSKLLLEIKVLGVSFQTLITKDINDLPYLLETMLYAVFGSWAPKVYKKPILIHASDSPLNVDTIVLKLDNCPFCCNTMIPPEKFGSHRYGKLMCLTIEQVIQLIQDYSGNDCKVVGREIECYLAGASKAELRFWLYPKDKLELMEKNEYLKKIK
ncbi:MAG: hypothetical protein ACFFDT_24395, partial [Candidatus Hodarchaeota archaeon]